MGRKTLYNPDTFPDLVRELSEAGHIDTEMAQMLGIGHTAYYDYQNLYPKFAEAIKEGKVKADDEVEASLYRNATVEMNVTAQIFWLKNRRPATWRDKHEVTGADGGPITFTFAMSNDDASLIGLTSAVPEPEEANGNGSSRL